jgi:C-terminal processing protease CtpA/Prc
MIRFAASFLSITSLVFTLILSGCASSPDIEPDKTVWSRAELESDLESWLDWTRSTHPAFEQSIAPDAFERRLKQVRAGLQDGMDTAEAWYVFALLNPVLSDAHLGLELPAIDPDLGAWPIKIDDGQAYVHGPDGERQEIVAVDDVPVPEMIARTLPVIRGESDALRQRILELRFRELVMLNLDGNLPSEVRLKSEEGAEHIVAEIKSAVSESGASPFSLQIRDSTAILRIDSFEKDLDAEFAEFVEESFARIATEKAARLVVDLRGNGGGAHEVSDRLLNYLTSERYTPISAVHARVTEANKTQIPGAMPGDVVEMPFAQWVQPESSLEHRFRGAVVVLIGPATYSQAIVFSTTVQDYQIGLIAGEETAGKANQTAQVQKYVLPNTGFRVRAPLYVLTRSSGEETGAGVMPDIPISNVEGKAIEQVLKEIDLWSAENNPPEQTLPR